MDFMGALCSANHVVLFLVATKVFLLVSSQIWQLF
jgi:hypothetical protein